MILSTGHLSISVEYCGSYSDISCPAVQSMYMLYISARLNPMCPTAPSVVPSSVLVAHNILLWTAVALVLTYFSVEACNADFLFKAA